MAEDGEKTEQPTARKREEARARGQIAKSQDLTAAVLLLVGLVVLDLMGSRLLDCLGSIMVKLLEGDGPGTLDPAQLLVVGGSAMREIMWLMLPILVLFFVAAVIVTLLQTGLLFTTEPLKINFEKLNPVTGLAKMFSPQSLVMMVINSAKMAIVAAAAYSVLAGQLDQVIHASQMFLPEMVAMSISIFLSLGFRVAIVLVILGIIDWFYQRYRHERSLRMTKQEVKEEMRRMDGDPIMKRRRREIQMRLAMQRLRQDVPQADVVVTNPTHVAVAIKYDAATMQAPRVLAKGEGLIAQRIRNLALDAGIPVVERKPLARALYKIVEVGQEVPPQFYKAVAEVLAYVYELSGRMPGATTG